MLGLGFKKRTWSGRNVGANGFGAESFTQDRSSTPDLQRAIDSKNTDIVAVI